MKVKNLIKALEKAGYKVEVTLHHRWEQLMLGGEKPHHFDRYHYLCKSATSKCSWYADGKGEIDCVKVMGIDQYDDMMIDYFPGIWCKTIKNIIYFMNK